MYPHSQKPAMRHAAPGHSETGTRLRRESLGRARPRWAGSRPTGPKRAAAAALLAVTLQVIAQPPPEQTAQATRWQDFYQGHRVCSVAEVARIRVTEEINVELRIDSRWAASLARVDQSVAEAWFALHCPPAALLQDQSLSISAPLPGRPPFRLNCADYQRAQRQQRAQRLAAARAALESAGTLVTGGGNR
jgi:hypothetical protein